MLVLSESEAASLSSSENSFISSTTSSTTGAAEAGAISAGLASRETIFGAGAAAALAAFSAVL